MTKARATKLCAALMLGVILPCAVTVWFFKTQMRSRPSLLGQVAPEFEAAAVSGDVFALGGYHGRRLALLFVNFDCPACVEELAYLDRLNREVASPGLRVLAVSEGGHERTLAFSSDFSLSFPLVIDPGSMRRDYRVSSEPTLILVDEKGLVRFHRSGPLPPVLLDHLIHDFAIDGKVPVEAVANMDVRESGASALEDETPAP